MTAQTAIMTVLNKNNKTPRNAVGRFPIGGEGRMPFMLSGAAMYVAEPNQSTRVMRAKITERGFMTSA